jgi:putative endonuclease
MAELADLPAGKQAHKDSKFMYYVYAIKSVKYNYIYVGLTNKLKRRLKQHNQGKERTTKPYIPFKLIYSETHNTRLDARKREKYFKSGCGKEFLKSLL